MAAWWSREKSKKKPDEAVASKRSVPSGLFQKCDECAATVETERVKASAVVLPAVRPSLRLADRRAHQAARRRGQLRRSAIATIQPEDPLAFADFKRYADRLRAAQKSVGHARRVPAPASATIDGIRVVDRLLRVRVHGRLDGLGRGREDHARVRARAPSASAGASSSPRRAARACRRASSRSCRWPRPPPRIARFREVRNALHLACCCTRRPAASRRRSRCSATSSSPSPRRSSASPGRASSSRPSARSCPKGFQRSEFLLEHGMIDAIVQRSRARRRRWRASAALTVGPRADAHAAR